MVVQLRRMAFLNKIFCPKGVDFLPPISKSSVGTPLFISFLGFTYIELQICKLLPKSECRFYLGGMTLKAQIGCPASFALCLCFDFIRSVELQKQKKKPVGSSSTLS